MTTTKYVTEDDLFEGDADALNEKIDKLVQEKLAAAEGGKKDSDADKAQPESLTQEQLSNFDATSLDYAIFKDDNETIRTIAKELLAQRLGKMKDGATMEDVNQAGKEVSLMLEGILAKKEAQEASAGNPYDEGPLPMGTSGAAAAHIKDEPPKTIAEAEELADRIASSFRSK